MFKALKDFFGIQSTEEAYGPITSSGAGTSTDVTDVEFFDTNKKIINPIAR